VRGEEGLLDDPVAEEFLHRLAKLRTMISHLIFSRSASLVAQPDQDAVCLLVDVIDQPDMGISLGEVGLADT
jgi:hypothetical protein